MVPDGAANAPVRELSAWKTRLWYLGAWDSYMYSYHYRHVDWQDKAARLPIWASSGERIVSRNGIHRVTQRYILAAEVLTLHPTSSELALMQPACHGSNTCNPAMFRQAVPVQCLLFRPRIPKRWLLLHMGRDSRDTPQAQPETYAMRLGTAYKKHTAQKPLLLPSTDNSATTYLHPRLSPLRSRHQQGPPLRSASLPLLRI
ncbi:hypothetical protein J3F83DRAFT_546804 [Trichoderma novae-zelandiae]